MPDNLRDQPLIEFLKLVLQALWPQGDFFGKVGALVEEFHKQELDGQFLGVLWPDAKFKPLACQRKDPLALVVIDPNHIGELCATQTQAIQLVRGKGQEIIGFQEGPDQVMAFGWQLAKARLLRAIVDAVVGLLQKAALYQGLEFPIHTPGMGSQFLAAVDLSRAQMVSER